MTSEQKQAVERVRDLAQNFLDWQIPSSPAAISQAGHDLSTLLALLDEQREALRPFARMGGLVRDYDAFRGELTKTAWADHFRRAALTGDQP